VLKVKMTEELEYMVKLLHKWRMEAQFGSEYSQIIVLLLDHGGEMTLKQLRMEALAFGIDSKEIAGFLADLERMRVVTLDRKNLTVKLRKEAL